MPASETKLQTAIANKMDFGFKAPLRRLIIFRAHAIVRFARAGFLSLPVLPEESLSSRPTGPQVVLVGAIPADQPRPRPRNRVPVRARNPSPFDLPANET